VARGAAGVHRDSVGAGVEASEEIFVVERCEEQRHAAEHGRASYDRIFADHNAGTATVLSKTAGK
jgi:hypothetical protein